MKILAYPAPALRAPARELTPEELNAELERFTQEMLRTMYRAQGVGLAANQVGRAERIVVLDFSPEKREPLILINPRLMHKSGRACEEEGCLSLPGIRARVRRARKIALTALDLQGQHLELEAEGLAARVFQHEMDHLEGMLFIDRLSLAKKFALRKELAKLELAKPESK